MVHGSASFSSSLRRSGADLFTGGDGPFTNERIAPEGPLQQLGPRARVTTLALAVVGLVLVGVGLIRILDDSSAGIPIFLAGLVLPLVPTLDLQFREWPAIRRRWARARGLAPAEIDVARLGDELPMLRVGVGRMQEPLVGELGGHRARMGTLVQDIDAGCSQWWIVLFELPESVASRHRGLSVMRPGREWPLEDDASELELEGVGLRGSARVFGAPGQDLDAARALLGGDLPAALAGTSVMWEQRGRHLLAYCIADHDGAYRDRACSAALAIYEHYLSAAR